MSAILFAGLLAAQASAITVAAPREERDVGYVELTTGRPAEALEKIANNRFLEPGDPAALINRGTAQARLGDLAAARGSYRAALITPQHYVLELQDGSWLDSRRAARKAMELLDSGRTIALK